jgi:AcrR family transcriptional regulator
MTARGRPRSFDRNTALDAATLVFWRRGYAEASMAELCQAMGINSPSLYAAFGSKEALFTEALGRYATTYGPRIWDPLDAGTTARDGVENWLMASAAILPGGCRPGGCMVTLAAIGGDGAPQLSGLLREGRAEGLRRITARLARGVAEGDVPATADAAAMARFYLGVQQGMSVQARDGAGRAALESVARAAMAGWGPLTAG